MLVLRRRLIRVLLTPRVAAWLLGGYLLVVAFMVFQPIPEAAVGSIGIGYRVVRLAHLTRWISPGMVEFAWNIAMFVPLTFLGSVLLPRLGWRRWTLLALLGSSLIELTQLVALPDRSATLRDVASNTIGGLLGALAAHTLARRQEQQEVMMGSDR